MKDFAVIETGGKQYIVNIGDLVDIELITGEINDVVKFDTLLRYVDGKVEVGEPYTKSKISGVIHKQNVKGKKIKIIKFKAKSRYRKVNGHRQLSTTVKFDTI